MPRKARAVGLYLKPLLWLVSCPHGYTYNAPLTAIISTQSQPNDGGSGTCFAFLFNFLMLWSPTSRLIPATTGAPLRRIAHADNAHASTGSMKGSVLYRVRWGNLGRGKMAEGKRKPHTPQTHTHTHIHTYIHTHTYTQIHNYIHTYTHIHAHSHTYT